LLTYEIPFARSWIQNPTSNTKFVNTYFCRGNTRVIKKSSTTKQGIAQQQTAASFYSEPHPPQKYTRHAKEELVCVALEHPRNWKLTTCQIFHLQMTDITSLPHGDNIWFHGLQQFHKHFQPQPFQPLTMKSKE
jgi:hypothetical protein